MDLRPTVAHKTALPKLSAVLAPASVHPSNTRDGELALQSMIRQTQQVSRVAAPNSLPVLLFLHGDKTGAPPGEIATLLGETLENSALLFVLNDGAIRSWGGSFLGMERSRILQYMAEQTGGAAMIAADARKDPDSYSKALAAILDRLHGRYQIGFVPQSLDGQTHRLEVRLTGAAKRAHPGLLLQSHKVYRAPLPARKQ